MDNDVARFVQKFEASEEASQPSRAEGERGRDYYDGNQLTTKQMAALKKRKQPPVIENLIRPKVDYLCGLERQTRTDPVAYPRTLKDDEAAQVATDVLRYVADDQKVDIKRSAVFQNMLIEGFGGVEVGAKQFQGYIDPAITQISWDRIFFDPHSCRQDFSDASYLGYITWMDKSLARGRWKGKEGVIDATVESSTSSLTDTYDDKPRWTYWADRSRNRVRIVTMYHKQDGVWHRVVFTLAGILEDNAPSPFEDEDGNPECALILEAAYVDRDNDRYGVVRDFFTLQDEVNKRRSKFLHLANTRQVRIDPASGLKAEQARKELARPDGVVIAGPGEVEIIGTGDMSAGHFTLLGEAKDAISRLGPNAQLQGKAGEGQSGRAILAMQQGGMTEMAPLLDALRDFNIRVFRAVWNRVRQFWTQERWVRITDDENAVRFAGVNIPQGALAMQKISEAVKSGQLDQQTAQQYALQVQSDPQMAQPANVLAEIDVDIQLDEVQNTPTLHAEQFEQLVNLASSGMMQIPPEIIIRASGLRDKQKLLDALEEVKEANQKAGQAEQELAQRGAIATIAKDESSANLNNAKAQGEVVAAGRKAFEAGRIAA